MCVCVCVIVFKYEHTYVGFFDICRDLPVKKSGKKSEDLFFSLQLRVEDEGRLEVPESPLCIVWEGWMIAGLGIQLE